MIVCICFWLSFIYLLFVVVQINFVQNGDIIEWAENWTNSYFEFVMIFFFLLYFSCLIRHKDHCRSFPLISQQNHHANSMSFENPSNLSTLLQEFAPHLWIISSFNFNQPLILVIDFLSIEYRFSFLLDQVLEEEGQKRKGNREVNLFIEYKTLLIWTKLKHFIFSPKKNVAIEFLWTQL